MPARRGPGDWPGHQEFQGFVQGRLGELAEQRRTRLAFERLVLVWPRGLSPGGVPDSTSSRLSQHHAHVSTRFVIRSRSRNSSNGMANLPAQAIARLERGDVDPRFTVRPLHRPHVGNHAVDRRAMHPHAADADDPRQSSLARARSIAARGRPASAARSAGSGGASPWRARTASAAASAA